MGILQHGRGREASAQMPAPKGGGGAGLGGMLCCWELGAGWDLLLSPAAAWVQTALLPNSECAPKQPDGSSRLPRMEPPSHPPAAPLRPAGCSPNSTPHAAK